MRKQATTYNAAATVATESDLPASVIFVIRELETMSNTERGAVEAWIRGGGCIGEAVKAYRAGK